MFFIQFSLREIQIYSFEYRRGISGVYPGKCTTTTQSSQEWAIKQSLGI